MSPFIRPFMFPCLHTLCSLSFYLFFFNSSLTKVPPPQTPQRELCGLSAGESSVCYLWTHKAAGLLASLMPFNLRLWYFHPSCSQMCRMATFVWNHQLYSFRSSSWIENVTEKSFFSTSGVSFLASVLAEESVVYWCFYGNRILF